MDKSALVDMKQSASQVKKTLTAAMPEDYYPLSLYLSAGEHGSGNSHQSLTLQIRKAAITDGKDKGKSAADTLYKD